MTNDELQQNCAGLGENAFEEPAQVNQEQENKEESFFGKPEKYDYSGVELPENYCYDENLLNEILKKGAMNAQIVARETLNRAVLALGLK